MSRPTAIETVAANPPDLDVGEVARHVEEQFGLTGDYGALVSERDQNFCLTTTGGERFVVKVTSSAEDQCTSDFHVATLLHLEEQGCALAPQVVRTLRGEAAGTIEFDGHTTVLRVVSFLDGVQLAANPIQEAIARDLGSRLAHLDVALQGFSHSGDRPVLLWDLQRLGDLRALLGHIDAGPVLSAVGAVIDDYERNVAPRIEELRRQVIHGDANPENILLDSRGQRISAFIDFSDSLNAPLVFDVAIAAAYLRNTGVDALALIANFVAAYHAANPLRQEEFDLLFDLVRARLAMTITILFWRLGMRRKGDPYREKTLRAESGAIAFLNALDGLGKRRFLARLRQEPGLDQLLL